MKENPIDKFSEELKILDVNVWAQESYKAANEVAYVNIVEGSKPTDTYLITGQAIAKKRLALAGYRLAQVFRNAYTMDYEDD